MLFCFMPLIRVSFEGGCWIPLSTLTLALLMSFYYKPLTGMLSSLFDY